MERYLVGGAVRDALLGRPAKDRDWVIVGATPEQLLAQGYRRVGKSFPVFLHPDSAEEHALACRVRGDLSTAAVDVGIEDDLRGRDLSINAIAQTPDGELIDPFGGEQDLRDRVLRPVDKNSFAIDPLRVLRSARLAAQLAPLGFRVPEETRRAMRALRVVDGMRLLPGERVWAEVQKALECHAPARFFEELRAAGVLDALFPELDSLFGVPQPERWHPEIDTGIHVMMVLTQAAKLSPRVDVRFAALTHDLGKGNTPADILPSHHGHEKRGVELLKRMGTRIRIPRKVADLARITAEWHGHAHKIAELRPATQVKLLERTDALRRPERFEHFLLACEADARGCKGLEDRPYPQAGRWREVLRAAQGVDVAALVASTAPKSVPKVLRQKRVAAVAALSR